jgi:hypothetical protein
MNCVIAGMTSSWTSNFITRPMRRQFSQSSRSAPDLNGESLPASNSSITTRATTALLLHGDVEECANDAAVSDGS